MKLHKKNTIDHTDTRYHYLQFDSVSEFNDFTDHQISNLSSSNQEVWQSLVADTKSAIRAKSEWYGTPPPNSIEQLNTHKLFLGMNHIGQIQKKIKSRLSKFITLTEDSEIPKLTLRYNERGLGIFSFDRALMGLHKIQAVDKSTPIRTTISQLNIALEKKQVQTSVRTVFASFDKAHGSFPSLKLFVTAGANGGVSGDDMLYVGLACAVLTDYMEQRGISVELNIIVETFFNQHTIIGQVRVKRFEDSLDKNQLLLMTSDPRYYRFRGFKALIAMSNYFDLEIPNDYGAGLENVGKNFMKVTHQKGFVFEQSYSIDSAVREVTRIISGYQKNVYAN